MELIRELNYICNSDIFLIVFDMKRTLPSRDDRNKVTQWLNKIIRTNKTLADLKLRNEFLASLKHNIQNGKLESPFNQEPPKSPLKMLAKQLPEHEDEQPQDDEDVSMLRLLPAKNGGYLLPKPLPCIGAYVYISGQAELQKKCGRTSAAVKVSRPAYWNPFED